MYLSKIGLLFEETKDFSHLEPIRKRFLLNNTEQTHVFWSYIQYMVDGFALRLQDNGTSGIIGTAGLTAGGLYEQFSNLTNYLNKEITAQTIYQNLTDSNTSCKILFNNSLSCNDSDIKTESICAYIEKEKEKWELEGILLMIDICRNNQDANSLKFMNKTGVTSRELMEICDFGIKDRITFGVILHDRMIEIKQQYNCSGLLDYCSDKEIALMQWGQSKITKNPPKSIAQRKPQARSVNGWDSKAFPQEIEYSAFVERFGKIFSDEEKLPLNTSFSAKLLTFDCLFSASVLQNLLIWKKNGQYDNITATLNIKNATAILEYLRYMMIYISKLKIK